MNKIQIQELQTLVTESQDRERKAWKWFNEVVDIANDFKLDLIKYENNSPRVALRWTLCGVLIGLGIGIIIGVML